MSEKHFDNMFETFIRKSVESYTKFSEDIAEYLRNIPGLEMVTAADVEGAIRNTRIIDE